MCYLLHLAEKTRFPEIIVEDGTFVYIAKRYARKTGNGKQKKVLVTLIPNSLFVYTTEVHFKENLKYTVYLVFKDVNCPNCNTTDLCRG